MNQKAARTKNCPACGEVMGKDRGVCPACGHMTGWFKVRLVVGGVSVLLAFLALIAMALTALWGR